MINEERITYPVIYQIIEVSIETQQALAKTVSIETSIEKPHLLYDDLG